MDSPSPTVTSSTKDTEGALMFGLSKSYGAQSLLAGCSRVVFGKKAQPGAGVDLKAEQQLEPGAERVLVGGAQAAELLHELRVRGHIRAPTAGARHQLPHLPHRGAAGPRHPEGPAASPGARALPARWSWAPASRRRPG